MELFHSSPKQFDKFDLSKIGDTTGVNKYGFGLYFSDSYDDVVKHAYQNTLPKQNIFIYTVKVFNSDYIVEYEEQVKSLFPFFSKLKEDEIENLERLQDEYGLSYRELHEYLESIYGAKETSSIFTKCHITGFKISTSGYYDTVYVIFSPDDLKILDVEQLQ